MYDGLVISSDNSGSLQLSVDMASTKQERALLRELAWRKAMGEWVFDVCHIPSENNTVADLLSMFFETPEGQHIKPEIMKGAAVVRVPKLRELWTLC